MSTSDTYVLGHTTGELDRLDLQGEVYRDITRRTLIDAGIQPGMRVLDVGCGSGDVARLAAELVKDGTVVAFDHDEPTVHDARARAQRAGLTNLTFRVSDPERFQVDVPFDAVVMRFVLMHQTDPAATLAQVARHVRPGGPVVAMESDMQTLLHGPHSAPHSVVYDEMVRWKCRVVEACGADTHAGLRMSTQFHDAGLPHPAMRIEAPVVGGSDSVYYRYMMESVRSITPQARQHGIDEFTDEMVDTLEQRLRDELTASHGTLVAWPLVSAWAPRP